MCVWTSRRLSPGVRLPVTVAVTMTVTTVSRPGPGVPACHRDGHGSKFQVQSYSSTLKVPVTVPARACRIVSCIDCRRRAATRSPVPTTCTIPFRPTRPATGPCSPGQLEREAPWVEGLLLRSQSPYVANRRALKGRPFRGRANPPPVVPHLETLAAQAAYTEALLPRSGSGTVLCHHKPGACENLW